MQGFDRFAEAQRPLHPLWIPPSKPTQREGVNPVAVRRERKNVNLPGVVVDLPTLTEKDEDDLVHWGLVNDIDFIAASFVRKGSDLDYIRQVNAGIRLGAGV